MRRIIGLFALGAASQFTPSATFAQDFDLEIEAAPGTSYSLTANGSYASATFGNTVGGLSFTATGGYLFSTTGLATIGIAAGGNALTFSGAAPSGSFNWQGGDNLYIGQASDKNSLTISDGANFLFQKDPGAADVILGYDDGGDDNTLDISGDGTSFATDGTIYVGRNGDRNELSITSGAVVTSLQGRVGGGSGSVSGAADNTVTVSGTGSRWIMDRTLRIGAGGTLATSGNSVSVEDGGRVTTGTNIILGYDALSANNELVVKGEGSSVVGGTSTSVSDLFVGVNVTDTTATVSTGNKVTASDKGTVKVSGTIRFGDRNELSLASSASVGAKALVLTAAADPVAKPGSTLRFDIDAEDLATLDVSGTAELGGTFIATFSGALKKRIDIVTAGTGVVGEFDKVDTEDLARGFAATMNYGLQEGAVPAPAGAAYLDIEAKLGETDRLGMNQRRVAGGLNASFNAGTLFSSDFVSIYELENPELQHALELLSGEVVAFGMTQGVWSSDRSLMDRLRAQSALEVGGAWLQASGFGGSAAGDSNDGTHGSDTDGSSLAAGFDFGGDGSFRSGVALSAGQSSFTAGDLGSGDLESLQVAGYAKATFGAVYVRADGLFGQHDLATRRASYQNAVPVPLAIVFYPQAETLDYDGSLSSRAARLETGMAMPISGATTLTPYMAVATGQSATKRAASEIGSGGGTFGLSFAGQSLTTSSTEVGARLDANLGDTSRLFLDLAFAKIDGDLVEASFTELSGSSFGVEAAGSNSRIATLSIGSDFALGEMSSAAASLNGTFGDRSTISANVGFRQSW